MVGGALISAARNLLGQGGEVAPALVLPRSREEYLAEQEQTVTRRGVEGVPA